MNGKEEKCFLKLRMNVQTLMSERYTIVCVASMSFDHLFYNFFNFIFIINIVQSTMHYLLFNVYELDIISRWLVVHHFSLHNNRVVRFVSPRLPSPFRLNPNTAISL